MDASQFFFPYKDKGIDKIVIFSLVFLLLLETDSALILIKIFYRMSV